MQTNLARKPDSDSDLRASTPDIASDARAEFAAQFIPAGSRVLDLGCGRTALRRFLPMNCTYRGADLAAAEDVTACDFNAGEFPAEAAREADIIAMLGTLERIENPDAFFSHVNASGRSVILSYCPADLTAGVDRGALGFVNHLSFYDLALLFDRHGYRIECTAPLDDQQVVMRLAPVERMASFAPVSVAVIADSDNGNFGGRLGFHMINSLLPGEADVHHLTFSTLERARERYDLVVLGAGTCFSAPQLGDDVLDVVKRGTSAIGIFGTQFRELIPRPALERVLERLNTWYAVHEDDVLVYGRGRHNIAHLGNWLVEQFPLTRASDDEPLQIDDGIMQELPLDRSIQTIQRHKNVFSTRLAPLLCALTSAEIAAYAEQPSGDIPGVVSGKFRSMLIDIFGRTYPERKFFIVDREAVARYKTRVHANVAALRAQVGALLQNVAAAA